MGTLVIERAGREAAKKVASTASTIAPAITVQGSAKAPMRWWEFDSRRAR